MAHNNAPMTAASYFSKERSFTCSMPVRARAVNATMPAIVPIGENNGEQRESVPAIPHAGDVDRDESFAGRKSQKREQTQDRGEIGFRKCCPRMTVAVSVSMLMLMLVFMLVFVLTPIETNSNACACDQ